MNNLKIEDILQSFYEISGMDVAVVNSKYRTIARRYSGAPYCSTIHRSPKCLERCVESDHCNFRAAHKKGGLHVYKCPFGIYEALVPIYRSDEVVAYVFVGMGIEDKEESAKALLDNALSVSPTLNRKALEKSIAETPNFPKAKLDAFASLLPLLAEYIEANNLLADSNMTIGQLVKTYVKNNLSKKITLSELSWKLHCSTVTLTEHFKKEYGITIMEYVMKKRMDKAEKLLEISNLSIRDVAEECGFFDLEYFSRCFKSNHGMSPSAWKRTYGNVIEKKYPQKNKDKVPADEPTPSVSVQNEKSGNGETNNEVDLRFGSCIE